MSETSHSASAGHSRHHRKHGSLLAGSTEVETDTRWKTQRHRRNVSQAVPFSGVYGHLPEEKLGEFEFFQMFGVREDDEFFGICGSRTPNMPDILQARWNCRHYSKKKKNYGLSRRNHKPKKVVDEKQLAERFPPFAQYYSVSESIGKTPTSTYHIAQIREEQVILQKIELRRLPQIWSRLKNRMTLLWRNPHNSICTPLACFLHRAELWVVMPLERFGFSIRQILRFPRPSRIEKIGDTEFKISPIGIPDESLIATIVQSVLTETNRLHQQGYVHRDIRGENILISPDGEVTLADSSILGYRSGDDQDDADDDGDLTANHTVQLSGPPCWLAPEIVTGEKYNYKSDIWQIGIVCLELWFGHAPREKMRLPRLQLLERIVNDTSLNIVELPDWSLYEQTRNRARKPPSTAFKHFVSMCLQYNPERRPTCEQLLKHAFMDAAENDVYITQNILSHVPEHLGYHFTRIRSSSLYTENTDGITSDTEGGGNSSSTGVSLKSIRMEQEARRKKLLKEKQERQNRIHQAEGSLQNALARLKALRAKHLREGKEIDRIQEARRNSLKLKEARKQAELDAEVARAAEAEAELEKAQTLAADDDDSFHAKHVEDELAALEAEVAAMSENLNEEKSAFEQHLLELDKKLEALSLPTDSTQAEEHKTQSRANTRKRRGSVTMSSKRRRSIANVEKSQVQTKAEKEYARMSKLVANMSSEDAKRVQKIQSAFKGFRERRAFLAKLEANIDWESEGPLEVIKEEETELVVNAELKVAKIEAKKRQEHEAKLNEWIEKTSKIKLQKSDPGTKKKTGPNSRKNPSQRRSIKGLKVNISISPTISPVGSPDRLVSPSRDEKNALNSVERAKAETRARKQMRHNTRNNRNRRPSVQPSTVSTPIVPDAPQASWHMTPEEIAFFTAPVPLSVSAPGPALTSPPINHFDYSQTQTQNTPKRRLSSSVPHHQMQQQQHRRRERQSSNTFQRQPRNRKVKHLSVVSMIDTSNGGSRSRTPSPNPSPNRSRHFVYPDPKALHRNSRRNSQATLSNPHPHSSQSPSSPSLSVPRASHRRRSVNDHQIGRQIRRGEQSQRGKKSSTTTSSAQGKHSRTVSKRSSLPHLLDPFDTSGGISRSKSISPPFPKFSSATSSTSSTLASSSSGANSSLNPAWGDTTEGVAYIRDHTDFVAQHLMDRSGAWRSPNSQHRQIVGQGLTLTASSGMVENTLSSSSSSSQYHHRISPRPDSRTLSTSHSVSAIQLKPLSKQKKKKAFPSSESGNDAKTTSSRQSPKDKGHRDYVKIPSSRRRSLI